MDHEIDAMAKKKKKKKKKNYSATPKLGREPREEDEEPHPRR